MNRYIKKKSFSSLSNNTLQKRDALTGFLFSLPAIAGMLSFFLVPFIISIFISLTDGINSSRFVGIKNYIDMLANNSFQLAAWNTGKFILVSVPLIMLISFFIAFLLHKKLRGYNFFRTVFVFPLVIPIASVVLFFQIIFSDSGMVNDLLSFLGVGPVRWLNSSSSFFVLVFLYIWKNCGYNIILFFAALNAIPKEYYEAADMDSSNGIKKTVHITLPMITPYLFFILIISIVNTFKSFREAYILFGDHPHQSIYMIQHFMNNNFQNLNYVRISTSAILIFVLISILIFLLFRLKNRTEDIEL